MTKKGKSAVTPVHGAKKVGAPRSPSPTKANDTKKRIKETTLKVEEAKKALTDDVTLVEDNETHISAAVLLSTADEVIRKRAMPIGTKVVNWIISKFIISQESLTRDALPRLRNKADLLEIEPKNICGVARLQIKFAERSLAGKGDTAKCVDADGNLLPITHRQAEQVRRYASPSLRHRFATQISR